MVKKFIIYLILVTFFFIGIGPAPDAHAQPLLNLPAPGVMIQTSGFFQPLQLKGIMVNAKNPLRFDFLVDKGQTGLAGQPLKNEITRLSKYFLTCLTVPEDDMWVNLSPYEKDHIIPGGFGITLMGKDLLEQDYLLKQIMASLSYPENEIGKRFWQKIYRKSYELYGTTEIPINTFKKVWIVPKSAQVYVQGRSAFVVKSQLDVMLEADYKSVAHHLGTQAAYQSGGAFSQIYRDLIIPQLRQEVNEGKNFAVVRQVYNAMILATWYKHHLKDSLLGKMYVGRNKVSGVDVADKNIKEKIFQQYLKAYRKCVYNYIKEDYDPITQQTIPRKYASGGMYFAGFRSDSAMYVEQNNSKGMVLGADLAMATIDVTPMDAGMLSNMKALARKVFLPLAALAAISVASPSHAAQFLPNGDVLIEKHDTLKKILQQAGYTAPYWGPQGKVAQIGPQVSPALKNYNKIYAGKIIRLPVKTAGQAATVAPVLAVAAEPKKVEAAAPVILETPPHTLVVSADSVSVGGNPPQTIVVTAAASQAAINAASALAVSGVSTHGEIKVANKLATDANSKADLSTFLPWLGIGLGGIAIRSLMSAMRQRKPKAGRVKISPDPEDLQEPQDDLPTEPAELVIKTSGMPALETESELAGLPRLKARLESLALSKDAPIQNRRTRLVIKTKPRTWTQIAKSAALAIALPIMFAIRPQAISMLQACGISVHSRFGQRRVLARQGDRLAAGRIGEMMEVESDRGRHEAGLLNMREQRTSTGLKLMRGNGGAVEVVTVVEKAVEAKRGPRSDSVDRVVDKMLRALPPINAQGPLAVEYVMDTWVGHNRLASADLVEKSAAHPHVGQEHEKVLWSLLNGLLDEGKSMSLESDVAVEKPDNYADESDEDALEADKVNVGAGHNGDGDAYTPLADDRTIDDLNELRSFAMQLVHFQGKLPVGDSPAIPLLIQFHLTQGNPDASVRFAHVMVNAKTVDEIKRDALTEEEEGIPAEVLNRGIKKFKSVLSRPDLQDPNKTLTDLYVDQEMVQAHPNDRMMRFQYQALQALKEYLVEEFKREAAEGNLPAKMTQHWQGPDADRTIRDFVELAVYKFFTGDRETAVREFQEKSKGTYGLAVKVSTDLNGLTLVSRKLGMVFGYNLKKGYLDAASDPYALLQKYPNGDMLDTLVYLDPRGKGEMANFQVSKKTGKLDMRIFSFELNRYLTTNEINKRKAPLKGKYFKDPHEYKNKKRRIMEDVQEMTPGVAELIKSFHDEEGFNYQSGVQWFKALWARWIKKQIDEEMLEGGAYADTFHELNGRVRKMIKECADSGNCSHAQMEFLNKEAFARPKNSMLMALIDKGLSDYALDLTEMRIKGEISQVQLQQSLPQAIDDTVKHLVDHLDLQHLEEIYWAAHEVKHSSNKAKIDLLFFGDEISDEGPQTSKKEWTALMPGLNTAFVSSYQVLEYQSLPFDISSPAATMVTSKAAGNFNSMEAFDIMSNTVGVDKIWGTTGTPYSPLSFYLGQGLQNNSPFIGHTFYIGNHYRTQTQATAGSLMMAIHNILPVFVALQFEKYCPGEHPFGLNLNSQKVEYLKLVMQKMMFSDAKRVTGRDEEGNAVLTPVSKALFKRGHFWSKRLLQSPITTVINWVFVYAICLFGAPLTWVGLVATHGLGWFAIAQINFLSIVLVAPILWVILYRAAIKYNLAVRLMGPPANISVIGKESFPAVMKMFLRVLFSRAPASWGTLAVSEPYEKAISYLGPIMSRGSWIWAHIPATSILKRKAQGALKQLKVTRTGILGTLFLRTGPISFTTSRGPYNDLKGVVSDYNVDIGGTEFIPPMNDEDMLEVFNTFDAWGAHVAFLVSASVMADDITFGGRAWDPTRKVNGALSLTTESGQPPPEKMPKERTQAVAQVEMRKNGTYDSAQLTRKGGIDMNSRLMDLMVTGDDSSATGRDQAMHMPAIQGVVPQVSAIVTVTPEMLKSMLGPGYLN